MGCQSLDDGFVSIKKARKGDDVEGGATSARVSRRKRNWRTPISSRRKDCGGEERRGEERRMLTSFQWIDVEWN